MLEGAFDLQATDSKADGLRRSRVMNVRFAAAFALGMFALAAPFAQGQAPAPQATPSSLPDASSPAPSGAAASPALHDDSVQHQATPIQEVAPVYPPVAKTAHISGTVLLQCIIGKDGTVQTIHYISGPPLLMKSAMDAVRQWKYTPTLINGKRVEVRTTVSLVFTLDGAAAAIPQAAASNPVERYKASGYVNDFAGVIDSKDRAQLDKICKDLDHKSGIQMAFVTIGSLEGKPIKDFAMDLANLWSVGHQETNRGLLILIAVQDGLWRISISHGLESVFPDEDADRLGRDMVPLLKTGAYGKALLHLAKNIQLELPPKLQ